MTRQSTITREQFFEAANLFLEQNGKAPTQNQMRLILDGGSFTTIGPFMREWQDAQKERVQAAETPLPDSVREVMTEAVAKVWKVAQETSAIALEAARREIEELRKASDDAEAQSIENVGIVEAERDAESKRADELERQLDLSQDECLKLTISSNTMKNEMQKLREENLSYASRLQSSSEKVEMYDKRLSETLKHVEVLQSENVTLREAIAKLKAERDAAASHLEASESRTSKAEARADKAEAKADALQSELSRVQSDFAAAREEHNEIKSQLSERLRLKADDLAKEHDEHDATKAKLAAALDKIAKYEKVTKKENVEKE